MCRGETSLGSDKSAGGPGRRGESWERNSAVASGGAAGQHRATQGNAANQNINPNRAKHVRRKFGEIKRTGRGVKVQDDAKIF